MTRRKSVCSKWTLVLLLVLVPYVCSRPQETYISPVVNISSNSVSEKSTENPIRESSQTTEQTRKQQETTSIPTADSSRHVKAKPPVIGESIKMVASQLLENPSNATAENLEKPIVIDTRIPPKVKNQLVHKHKNKRHDNGDEPLENAHAGEAVPVTMEELEKENHVHDIPKETSTSNEGLSTWILLSNPDKKENVTTEPTKVEEPPKKPKPNNKNKTKKPPANKPALGKRPIIGSINKSDLVASGSAINENVLNKIKDTVLSNVQKNKSSSQRTTTTSTTTTTTTTTLAPSESTKKEVVTKSPSTVSIPVKLSSKPSKKKNKNKQKTTTTVVPTINDSALLPMEPKEQEIELEISTPATTTKKPKRSSTRKKTKTKKRKTTKPKPETVTAVSEVKHNNKTKSTKTKKPSTTSLTGPITSQIYNYLSREVMPSVGVGMLGLASLVGIAGYFLYPFSTPVRRTFEVDKKDDIYRHNAEEYAQDGNGQAEEEMLGTVLAGMPAHAKQKLNPYAGQTTHVNAYPLKKEQDLRYRHVATKYQPSYSARYPQQKTGIAHGAVYPEPMNYNQYHYDTRQIYTTENKYLYDKGPSTSYTVRPASVAPPVEPIYAAPQTGPTGISSYGSDTSNSVVYGIKPSSDSDFRPVYPYEGQFYNSEVTTSSPMSYPSTSLYLGSNDESVKQEENDYADNQNSDDGSDDSKFVVGNVPKELAESATPAVVPEHGPRNLNRRKRYLRRHKRGISGSIEQILREEKEKNKDIFISNEIDEALGLNVRKLAAIDEIPVMNNAYPVYSVSMDSLQDSNSSTEVPTTTIKNDIIESISTVPIKTSKQEKTTESSNANDLDTTTKMFKVYEVFPSTDTDQGNSQTLKAETTTQSKNMNTETTTELKSETTSTMPPSPSPVTDFKMPTTTSTVVTTPAPTNNPEVLTYPPLNQDGGFFTFLKRLIEFKYRLGLSILQTTSENLNRYLRNMESSVNKVANASKH